MADNLKQVSHWTHKGFHKEEDNIKLFLKLARKDLDELHRFPLPKAFMPAFKKFCTAYERLEKEYHEGIKDHKGWADGMESCAQEIFNKHLLV